MTKCVNKKEAHLVHTKLYKPSVVFFIHLQSSVDSQLPIVLTWPCLTQQLLKHKAHWFKMTCQQYYITNTKSIRNARNFNISGWVDKISPTPFKTYSICLNVKTPFKTYSICLNIKIPSKTYSICPNVMQQFLALAGKW